jgi:hypothetical protein
MISSSEKATIVTTTLHIRPEATDEFINWQAKFNASIAAFPGFVSLEFLLTTDIPQPSWAVVQRFKNYETLLAWRSSPERHQLLEELQNFLVKNEINAIQDIASESSLQDNVTEVFVTQVNPDKEMAYRQWTAKIHQIEAKFPGFRGVYVQSPTYSQGRNWITLLQFDTPENLDHWLSSPERKKILSEVEPLISSLESHRVISPYAGWFASVVQQGQIPSVWKQTMVVLLVLFPIVILELKYLSPLTANLNSSVATFIGNAISVTLIAWPFMPIAIWFLGWWLAPKGTAFQQKKTTLMGMGILILLYFLEIATFWNFL